MQGVGLPVHCVCGPSRNRTGPDSAFKKFASINIPIPPEDIQQRIVAHVDNISTLEKSLGKAKEALESELDDTLGQVGLASNDIN